MSAGTGVVIARDPHRRLRAHAMSAGTGVVIARDPIRRSA